VDVTNYFSKFKNLKDDIFRLKDGKRDVSLSPSKRMQLD
jgi:hypothetical protein